MCRKKTAVLQFFIVLFTIMCTWEMFLDLTLFVPYCPFWGRSAVLSIVTSQQKGFYLPVLAWASSHSLKTWLVVVCLFALALSWPYIQGVAHLSPCDSWASLYLDRQLKR